MATVFDDDISGAGIETIGTSISIDHWTFTLDVAGPGVSSPNAGAEDHILHCGWIALGYHLDDGPGEFDYWTHPVFLNFAKQIWPETAFVAIFANRVRWWLSPGTSGHLGVFGSEG